MHQSCMDKQISHVFTGLRYLPSYSSSSSVAAISFHDNRPFGALEETTRRDEKVMGYSIRHTYIATRRCWGGDIYA